MLPVGPGPGAEGYRALTLPEKGKTLTGTPQASGFPGSPERQPTVAWKW